MRGRKKRQRPSYGTRHQSAIQRSMPRRPAPSHVTLDRIGRSNAPEIMLEVREFRAQVDAELPVHPRGGDGILEVIQKLVVQTPEIEPGV